MLLTATAADQTEQSAWETFVGYAELPTRIIFLIIVGLVLRWLVFRAIDRMLKRVTAPPPAERNGNGNGKATEKLRNGLRNGLSNPRQTQRATALGSLLKSLTTGVVGVVIGLMILASLGFDLGPFLASAGVAGVAIGFGAQSLVKDLVSGVFMLLEDQFGVGDYVTMNEVTGTVESVGLRITRLRDDYGTLWSIRNGEVLQVGNKSMSWVAIMPMVQITSDQDVEHASRVIDEVGREVAAANPDTVLEAPVCLGVQQVTGSTITLLVYGQAKREVDRWGIERQLRIGYKRRFDEQGIRMPEVDLYSSSS